MTHAVITASLTNLPSGRPPRRAQVQVRCLGGSSALDYLDEHWPALYAGDDQATPYQSRAWLGGWAMHQPTCTEPVVIVAQEGPDTVAAMAMARDVTDGRILRLRPLSAPTAEIIRPVGPGAEDPSVVAALIRHLTAHGEHGTEVILPDIPADSMLGRQLRAQWTGHLAETPYATVALPVDYSALSRSTRREHRRRQRTWDDLSSAHRVLYRRTHSPTDLLETYPDLLRLHRLEWPQQEPDTENDAAWHTVLERCGPGAFIATLAVDGHTVAAQLCLRRGTRAYSLLPAMDPAYRSLAPGHALLRYLTADLAATGHRTLDLGRTTSDPGQHGYKSQYGVIWTSSLTAST
ncbi:GNAT family N-acetyltransferase [Streptomyces sp. NPDC001165]|uniref:GNAT family N-acetyltransferase n=1 Tax=Streptomyces sp. NPDC001165 TaxID=3364546 RepID=UPI0036821771